MVQSTAGQFIYSNFQAYYEQIAQAFLYDLTGSALVIIRTSHLNLLMVMSIDCVNATCVAFPLVWALGFVGYQRHNF